MKRLKINLSMSIKEENIYLLNLFKQNIGVYQSIRKAI